MLDSAVGVQEIAAEVGNDRAVPLHDHARLLRDDCHRIGLQIFRRGGGDEGLRVLGRDDHRHALLRFGDRELRTVQTVVLFAHGVQIDAQAVGQLADGNADAAGAKVVAALDETGHGAVSEQALDLALLGGVALLDFGCHRREGFQIVALGGAGRAADAVAARAAAQQDDHISGCGAFAPDVIGGRCRHHRAAFQALCNIAFMVKLRHMARGKAYLVAVRGIARRGGLAQLTLRQLAGKGFIKAYTRIARAGYAHCLMDVRPAGQRIAYAAAYAGGSASEWFNLSRVVMGFVFEHQ